MTRAAAFALAVASVAGVACRGPRIAERADGTGSDAAPSVVADGPDATAKADDCPALEGRKHWLLVTWSEPARHELEEAARRGVVLVRATSCGLRVVSTLGTPYSTKAVADCEPHERTCPGPIDGCARFVLREPDEFEANLAPPLPAGVAPLAVQLRPSAEFSYGGPAGPQNGATHLVRRIVVGTASSRGTAVSEGPIAVDLAPLEGKALDVDCGPFTEWNGLYCEGACFHADLARCEARCDCGLGRSCTRAGHLLPEASSPAERAALYGRACDHGDPEGCAAVLSAYDANPSALVGTDPLEAAARGCALDAPSRETGALCWEASKRSAAAGHAADAAARAQAACEKGSAPACEALSYARVDDAAALVRACDACNANACSALARGWVAGAHGAAAKEAARQRAIDALRPFCTAIDRRTCELLRSFGGTVPAKLQD